MWVKVLPGPISPEANDESSATTLCCTSPPPPFRQTTVVPAATVTLLGVKKLSPRSISTRAGFAAGGGLGGPKRGVGVAGANGEPAAVLDGSATVPNCGGAFGGDGEAGVTVEHDPRNITASMHEASRSDRCIDHVTVISTLS